MKKSLIVIVVAAVAFGGWFMFVRDEGSKPSDNQSKQTKKEVPFDKTQYSIDESESIWVVVNKLRPLDPKMYKPANLVVPNVALQDPKESEEMKLRADVAHALETLVNTAKKEGGFDLMFASGYRGYIFQENLYNRYVRDEGQASAGIQSARPGHSEHQTGLAADLAAVDGDCVIEECFADTPEGKWIAKNAHRFGFIIRYKKDKTDVTGYAYEPWHLRYVGDALATEIYEQNTTLEEFFGLPAAANYQPDPAAPARSAGQ